MKEDGGCAACLLFPPLLHELLMSLGSGMREHSGLPMLGDVLTSQMLHLGQFDHAYVARGRNPHILPTS